MTLMRPLTHAQMAHIATVLAAFAIVILLLDLPLFLALIISGLLGASNVRVFVPSRCPTLARGAAVACDPQPVLFEKRAAS